MSIICCLSYLYSFFHYASLFSQHFLIIYRCLRMTFPHTPLGVYTSFCCLVWLSPTFWTWLNATYAQTSSSSVSSRVFHNLSNWMSSLSSLVFQNMSILSCIIIFLLLIAVLHSYTTYLYWGHRYFSDLIHILST